MRDAIQQKLVKAVERRERAYLWTPADAITFVPRVLSKIYGDGGRLYAVSTTNQRPAYWVIRVDSTCDSESFGELTDEILTELEDEFGNGRCSWSGNNLFWNKRDRRANCDCPDCRELPIAKWPMVDGDGGCSWGRMQWPAGFETREDGYLLAATQDDGNG